MSDKTPFYLVWNPNGRSPVYRHLTKGSAETEAERLARENPGFQFFVLAPLCVKQRKDIETTRFGEPPF